MARTGNYGNGVGIAAKFSVSRSCIYYWLKYREELGFGKAA